MRWFEGSVSEAIAESKRVRSVFIVYITGGDEESKNMDTALDSDQISAASSKDCTAIKLQVDSVEGKQFALIYPVVCIPCTYFINGEGTPLEVIGGSLSVEQLVEKIHATIQKHRAQFPLLDTETSSSSASSSQSVPSQPVVEDSSPDTSNPDLTERVDRAKLLIERKRREREEKEKAELRKETERRQQGQQVSQAKVEREELLTKQMAERVRQEKAKDKAAREAIRQKIAQDRAERAAKQEIEKKERLDAAARIDPQLSRNDQNVRFSDVRIQFRLHDGTTVTQAFPADGTLETARQFICLKMNLSDRITFWTTFPRKRLGADDFPKTFSELGLAPSAALVVDPTSRSSSKESGDSQGLSAMLSLFLAPLLALMSMIKMFLFGSPQQRSEAPHPETTRETTSDLPHSSSTSSSNDVRKRTTQSGKSDDAFKKDGKIHSFRQGDNGDDENNTWNGNSTQQM